MTKSTLLLCLLLPFSLRADVRMPDIFGDHMAVQQNLKLPFWGWADPGEKITVQIGDTRAETVTAENGKWRVALEPIQSTHPVEVIITGKNRIVFTDVLVGDVWLCSGQSNMEFALGNSHNASVILPTATNSQIRLFRVPRTLSFTPLETVTGKWEIATPETARSFSAVAYFFGSEIQKARQIPIGLIESCWGGTPAQSWTSLEALSAVPALQPHVNQAIEARDQMPRLMETYQKETFPKWEKENAAWQSKYGADLDAKMKSWEAAAAQAKKNGQMEPPKPRVAERAPQKPEAPDRNPKTPSALYNGMIHPLLTLGIKGVIWYQGESNGYTSRFGKEYEILFPTLITDWRKRWEQGDFPFLYVQLAGLESGSGYPWLRNAQLKTLTLPNTAMAVIFDVGEPRDLHPKNKQVVGQRLALAARRLAYGETLVASGPRYDSLTIEGNAIRLTFTETGSGLVIGSAPALRLKITPPAPLDHIEGFTIAGSDGKFVAATARIDGNTVIVSNPEVSAPVAVRYAWAAYPVANLYNKEGLPASPFATDNP